MRLGLRSLHPHPREGAWTLLPPLHRHQTLVKGASGLPPLDRLLQFLVDSSGDGVEAVHCANCDLECSKQAAAWGWGWGFGAGSRQGCQTKVAALRRLGHPHVWAPLQGWEIQVQLPGGHSVWCGGVLLACTSKWSWRLTPAHSPAWAEAGLGLGCLVLSVGVGRGGRFANVVFSLHAHSWKWMSTSKPQVPSLQASSTLC